MLSNGTSPLPNPLPEGEGVNETTVQQGVSSDLHRDGVAATGDMVVFVQIHQSRLEIQRFLLGEELIRGSLIE